MSKHIAIDLGAESGRVVVATLDHGRITLEETYRFMNGVVRIGESLYWDVLHLWDEVKKGLCKVAAEQGNALSSLSVDSWGVDFALLDRTGKLLGNPHAYRDPRTNGMMERAFELVPRNEIYRQSSGIQFMSINTLYQLLAMVEYDDPQLRLADTFLMIPDLFHYWMAGCKVCEYTNATTTQFYNSASGEWSRSLLQNLCIPTHILPAVVVPGTRLGTLLSSAEQETKLSGITVVAPATHDTASAVVAVPGRGKNVAWLSSGTWSLLGASSPEPIVSDDSLKYNFSSYGGAGGVCLPWKNIMGLWLLQECRRSWNREEGITLSYEDLTEMARKAPPFSAVIDPDDPMFLAPADMAEAIAAFCRRHAQPVPSDKARMVRVILESLALRYRWTLEKLSIVLGHAFEALHVVGGGCKNRLLCQFTANAIGLPVIAGPIEASAVGNAALQAIAMGELASLDEARNVILNSFDVEVYEPQESDPWDEAYGTFMSLEGL